MVITINNKKFSLKRGLLLIILLCWILPIIIIMSLSGALIGKSYKKLSEQELDANTKYAIKQVQLQLQDAIQDSKNVSYDGAIRNAYRIYTENSDNVSLYQTINEYLSRNFSRKNKYQAVYVSFWDENIDANTYVLNCDMNSYDLLKKCKENVPEIHSIMKLADTDTKFIMVDDSLYLARNLFDSHFRPYASIVMIFDPSIIFQSLDGIVGIKDTQITLDNASFFLNDFSIEPTNKTLLYNPDVYYLLNIDEHKIEFIFTLTNHSIIKENMWILWLALVLMLMVLPLLFIVIGIFHHHITAPIETIVRAYQTVENGNRGYEILQTSPNMEFSKLYEHFNEMSIELKKQFERSYLEQQATQKAQIKALQSQINPHFLNNTLEIINWEARLADNENVSNMIEALSTMLSAALDRKGRTQIPLHEELGYIDAYLYIIQVRLGDSFHVYKEIDDSTLEVLVPRLILQPIVENAIQHDITENRGGKLWVRAYLDNENIVLEVEHDGRLSESDKEKINSMLSSNEEITRVGIKNVYQRIKLIYGENGMFTFTETDENTILVKIIFSTATEKNNERSPL